MRWVGHVARMEDRRGVHGVLVEKRHWESQGVDGRIILRWIFRKWDGGAWTGLIWLRIGTGGGYCKCGNEPSGYKNCGKFLD